MDIKFRVAGRISKPVEEVFEAVADPDKLSAYFTTGGAKGRLEEGATVMWEFHDYPGAFEVQVIEVVPNERIVLEWPAYESEPPNVDSAEAHDEGAEADYNTTVTMTFKEVEGGTLVEIAEEGWRNTDAARRGSYGNCMGWSQMVCAMKAWMEYGINLREGLYK
ncbi:SRPBCC domain-containing protein [Aurantiacibacter sp. D1-12]|uniref:SRPBCC domain-containing protein n=1 Tax=Aurantiacibacter sp. D1-12 TaxID=2993658 RepID=UPI00237C7089|nr:SRPBCC domain-containing protein [Aurantiacibacter sp. D1-12]MDE1467858.1 SRPBCC domain-containing protein [Aurantiacibacter sp. D1-12]